MKYKGQEVRDCNCSSSDGRHAPDCNYILDTDAIEIDSKEHEKCDICHEVKEVAFDDYGIVACFDCKEQAYNMTERRAYNDYLLDI